MSVAAESSPISVANKILSKRTYEACHPPDAAATLATQPAALKRGRGAAAAAAGGPGEEHHAPPDQEQQHPSFHPHDRAYVLGDAARTALRGLFPEMSEQVRRGWSGREQRVSFFSFARMAVSSGPPENRLSPGVLRASARPAGPPEHARAHGTPDRWVTEGRRARPRGSRDG